MLELPERGVELNLLDWGGDGPLAVLSHANGFCARVWEPVALRLREHFRVIGFDGRGHGDSTKLRTSEAYGWEQFVGDLIQVSERLSGELGRPRVELAVGHSFGGTVTLSAAARRPDLFARIALLDPVLIPSAELAARSPRLGSALGMGEIARKRRNVWPTRAAVREAWKRREPFQSWDPRVLELYLLDGMRERADGQVELKCPGEIEGMVYESEEHLDAFGAAKKLQIPALLVWAKRGNFPLEWYRKLRDTASDMQLVESDADHLLPMVAPDLMAELLLRFGTAD